MNLSFSSDVSAEASDDRPDATEEALLHRRRIGYLEGSPLVEPPGFDGVKLGESLNDSYSHYQRGNDLFLPFSGGFLQTLFSQPEVGSIEDAAEELREDVGGVEKAIDLHGIDVDDVESEVDPSPNHEVVTLPNGEKVPVESLRVPPQTDARLLHALLGSYGLSAEETALYLSEELGENVNEREVRQAAESANIL